MPRSFRRVLLFSWCLVGCSGEKAGHAVHPKTTPAPGGHAPVEGGAPAVSLNFTSHVPMAPMPPPFRFGSKKASVRAAAGLIGCTGEPTSKQSDPESEALRMAKACAAASKARPLATPVKVNASDGGAAQTVPFKATAGTCYRLYAAAGSDVRAFSLLLADATGASALEAHGDSGRLVAPQEGLLCFTEGDEAAKVIVSVGAGSGPIALEIWGN